MLMSRGWPLCLFSKPRTETFTGRGEAVKMNSVQAPIPSPSSSQSVKRPLPLFLIQEVNCPTAQPTSHWYTHESLINCAHEGEEGMGGGGLALAHEVSCCANNLIAV